MGVSSLGGAHLSLGTKLIDLAKKEDIKKGKIYLIGGAIPEDDMEKLNIVGFDAIFTSGATKDEIISKIKNLTKKL